MCVRNVFMRLLNIKYQSSALLQTCIPSRLIVSLGITNRNWKKCFVASSDRSLSSLSIVKRTNDLLVSVRASWTKFTTQYGNSCKQEHLLRIKRSTISHFYLLLRTRGSLFHFWMQITNALTCKWNFATIHAWSFSKY